MAWIYLLIAGLLEVSWAVGLKAAMKHPRYWPMLLAFVLSIASILVLAKAMKDLPLGTSYAVWTGIGAMGAAVFGGLLFGEQFDPWKLLFMGFILVGIIGLKWSSPH